MRSVFLLLFFLPFFLLTACKNESQDLPKGDDKEQTAARQQSPDEVIGVVPYEGGVISEQTHNFVEGLITGYWYIAGYVSIKDPENAPKKYTGRWYQFTADGHLKAGKWKEEVTKGTWTYHPSIAVLTIRTEDPDYRGEYKIRMTKDRAIMLWIGTERFDQTDVQAKLETYLQLMDTLP